MANDPLPPDPDEREEEARILLVDDTPENLVALEAVLSDLGASIVKAESGEEALRELLRQNFTLIILDVNMPGLDGFETAALIRERRNSEHTPIIFVSAINTSETYMFRGYALGAVDYIFTPVVPQVLRSKASVFIDLLRKTNEIKRQSKRLREIEENEHRQQLRAAADRIELETKRNRFFNLSRDLMAITEFNGRFIQTNPAFHDALGFSEESLQSKSLAELLAPEDRSEGARALEQLKSDGMAQAHENRFLRLDGSRRWLSWTVSVFLEEALLYFFARDVTARREAEEEVQKLNRDLERRASQLASANQELESEILVRKKAEQALKETNAELESFSYSVSHDLRAPLRAMQAFAEALLQDYSALLDETGRDFTRRIMRAAARMQGLIEDLLAYSQVSQAELKLQRIALAPILREALANLNAPIAESQAQIQVEEPLPDALGHPATAQQIFCNLLSNAIKFVPRNVRPQIRIRGETRGHFVRVSVEDNGIGIDPEHHARIFRVFERLHGMETYPGTGIGLAIVRKGAERMGGRCGLESARDRGSKFWIELPLARE